MTVGGVVLPAFAAAPTGPTLTLSPDAGHPRLPFKAVGSGFMAGETVDLSFDGAPLGTAGVGEDGSFRARARVPATASPGYHPVLAEGQTSGLSASATFLVRTDWPRFTFDGANRWNRFENVLNTNNVDGLTELWSLDTGLSICGFNPCGVALDEGILYFTDLSTVWAADGSTGAIIWSHSLSASPQLGPIVVEGMVVVGLHGGTVLSLDVQTGETVWSVKVGPNVWGTVAADAERLYIPNYEGWLVALDVHDGTVVWSVDLGSSRASGAVVAQGVVFVGTDANGTYALDASTGVTIWRSPETVSLMQTVAYSSGLVFTGSSSGDIAALDASSGETVWSVGLDHVAGMWAAAAADGRLFISTTDLGWNYALDARTGDVLWSLQESDFWASAPAVANGVVYIGNDNGKLVARKATTGATLWIKDELYIGWGPPIVADGRLFVHGYSSMWAFGLPDA